MRNMLRCMLIPFLCLLGLFCSLQAQDAPILKIAALHPVLGDMARSIGGSRVQVADLLRPNGNLHSFEPDRKSTRLNSSHKTESRMPSSA